MARGLCRAPGQSHPFSGLTLNLTHFRHLGPLPFPLGGGGSSLSRLNTLGEHGPCRHLCIALSAQACSEGFNSEGRKIMETVCIARL